MTTGNSAKFINETTTQFYSLNRNERYKIGTQIYKQRVVQPTIGTDPAMKIRRVVKLTTEACFVRDAINRMIYALPPLPAKIKGLSFVFNPLVMYAYHHSVQIFLFSKLNRAPSASTQTHPNLNHGLPFHFPILTFRY